MSARVDREKWEARLRVIGIEPTYRRRRDRSGFDFPVYERFDHLILEHERRRRQMREESRVGLIDPADQEAMQQVREDMEGLRAW